MADEEMFEQKIELGSKERVELLMLESAQRDHLGNYKSFELKPSNLIEFRAMRRQATFDNILSINRMMNKKFDVYRIHPDFNKYFQSAILEKKDKKKEQEHHAKWHGFLRGDWKKAFTTLMKIESEYQPSVALLVDFQKVANIKYENYIFTGVPSMHKEGIPSFGRGRTRLAAELHLEGKTNKEIAQAIGKSPKDVSQYVKVGLRTIEKERAKTAEAVKPIPTE